MTDIVTIPDVLPISPYPALGSTNFNNEAYAYATSVPPAVSRMREIAVACRTCAIAAQEYAQTAQAAASTATTQADAAMGYRNAAQASATAAAGSASTASTHASNAVGAYTQMQALYLGAKTSNPVKDNQGNALQLGAWYTYVGTDPDLKGVWLWWDGTDWNPGIGVVISTLMPKSGGTFAGPINVPAGATGSNAAPANEVVGRAPRALTSGSDLNSLPAENGFFTVQNAVNAPTSAIWHYVIQDVHTTTSYKLQIASPLEQVGQVYYRRSIAGTWGPWAAQIDDLHVMERLKFISLPTETTYTANPAEASIHYVSIYNAVLFTIPTGRQLGDQLTIRVYSNSGVRPITFSSNVALPKNQTMPTYAANDIVTFTLIYGRTGIWDLFYAGVHAG